MCILVDANRAAAFYNHPPQPEAKQILDWLLLRDGGLVMGGRLKKEHLKAKSEEAQRLWLVLKRAGRLHDIADAEVDAEEARLAGTIVSDDPHVLALARVSGARLLYSEDQPLMTDWGNKRLLDRPRGKVYRRIEHSRLLAHIPSCPHSKQRSGSRDSAF